MPSFTPKHLRPLYKLRSPIGGGAHLSKGDFLDGAIRRPLLRQKEPLAAHLCGQLPLRWGIASWAPAEGNRSLLIA
jgi:hypothetical protein